MKLITKGKVSRNKGPWQDVVINRVPQFSQGLRHLAPPSKQTGIVEGFVSKLVYSAEEASGLAKSMTAHALVERFNKGLSIEVVNLNYNVEGRGSGRVETMNEVLQLFQNAGGVLWETATNAARIIFHNHSLGCIDLAITASFGLTSLSFTLQGARDLILEWERKLDAMLKIQGTVFSTITEIDEGANGSVSAKHEFIRADTPKAARAIFYPFLKMPMEEYFDKYMASSASVLILVGPPGTGKSTLLRTLMLLKAEYAMLAYNSEVLKKPKLFGHYSDDKATILGLEDVDVFLEDRDRGNQLMGSFLNATEGVVGGASKTVKKVVFSTNLPSVDRIDAALMRRGRCFDVIEFRHLTVPEARAVEKEMGLPEQDLSFKDHWSLAEILNPPDEKLQMSERTRKHIGFV